MRSVFPKVRLLLVLFCAGLLLAIGTPPFSFPLAPLVGVTVLAAVLLREVPNAKTPQRTIRRGFGLGFVFGVGINIAALRFVPAVIVRFTPLSLPLGVLALVLVSLAQGLAFGVLGGVFAALLRLGVKAPVAFGMAMFASTYTPAVFPWTIVTGLTPFPLATQTADLVGERGVAAIWAFICALVAYAHHTKDKRAAIGALASALVVFGYGAVRLATFPVSDGSVKVGLVSQAVEPKERWITSFASTITSRLHELTRSTEREGATLTVWPEAAYPYATPRGTTSDVWGERSILGPGIRGPVLTGIILRHAPKALGPDDPGGSTNSAVLVTYDKLQGVGQFSEPSDKIHLLAFGEHVPFTTVFPQLRRIFFRGGKGLVPGARNILQTSGAIRAGMLNCFEDTLSDAGRGALVDGKTGKEANLLINVTNDSWFKDSMESPLHEQMARLRAVELRRDLVRAVNYGPLSHIDAAGRVRARRYVSEPTFLVVSPTLRDGMTIFARVGDLPMAIAFLALFVFRVFAIRAQAKGIARA